MIYCSSVWETNSTDYPHTTRLEFYLHSLLKQPLAVVSSDLHSPTATSPISLGWHMLEETIHSALQNAGMVVFPFCSIREIRGRRLETEFCRLPRIHSAVTIVRELLFQNCLYPARGVAMGCHTAHVVIALQLLFCSVSCCCQQDSEGALVHRTISKPHLGLSVSDSVFTHRHHIFRGGNVGATRTDSTKTLFSAFHSEGHRTERRIWPCAG